MNKDQEKALRLLKQARGQVDATIKMLEEGRYCVDISNQILASQSLLKSADLLILRQHLNHCVSQAIKEDHGEAKIDEIMNLLAKSMGK